jgi:hypothetical protein
MNCREEVEQEHAEGAEQRTQNPGKSVVGQFESDVASGVWAGGLTGGKSAFASKLLASGGRSSR